MHPGYFGRISHGNFDKGLKDIRSYPYPVTAFGRHNQETLRSHADDLKGMIRQHDNYG